MNDLTPTIEELAARLKSCELQLDVSFQNSCISMAHVSADGRWLRINRAFSLLSGYEHDELQGRPVDPYLAPMGGNAAAPLEELRAESNGSTRFRRHLVCKDGTRIVAEICASFCEAEGFFALAILNGRQPPLSRKQQSFLASIVESSEDAIIGKTLDGTILSWNRGAQAIYGYTAEEMIGRPVQLLAPAHLRDEVSGILERVRTGERVSHYETERQRKGGEIIVVSLTVSPVHDSEGRIIGASTISRDITRKKRDEQTAQETVNLLDQVFSSVTVLLAYLDRDLNYRKVNRAYATAHGRDPQDFTGQNLLSLHPGIVEETVLRHVVETGEPFYVYECPTGLLNAPEGTKRYWDWRVQPVTGAAGNVEGIVLSLLDVTDKVRARESLEQTTYYTRTLIESNLDPLVTIGPEGTITDVNAATEAATGRPRQQIIGTDFSEYFTDPGRARAIYQEVFREGFVRDYPLELKHASGKTIPVLYNASVYRDASGKVVGAFAAARDISALKEAEAALSRREAELREAQGIAHLGNWRWIAETDTVTWSPEVYAIFGRSPEAPAPRYAEHLEILTEESLARVHEAVEKTLQTGEPFEIEVDLVRPDGSRRWAIDRGIADRDAAGRVVGLHGTFQDITERKQTEDQLRVTVEKYRTLLNAMSLGVSMTDKSGNLIEANAASEKLLGIPLREQVGRKIDAADWKIIRPDGEPLLPEEFASVRALREGRRSEMEMGLVKENGEITWLSVAAVPIPLEDYGVLITYVDVTEQKKAEEALRRSEERYRSLFERIFIGYAVHEILLDSEGKPYDYRFLEVNPAFEAILGLPKKDVIGKTVRELIPDVEPYWIETYGRVALTGSGERLERYSTEFDRHFEVVAFSPAKGLFATLFYDVTERRRAAQLLELWTREQEALARLGISALSEISVDDLMDQSVHILVEILGVEYSKVLELLPDGSGFLLRSGVGWKEGAIGNARVGAGMDSQAGYTLVSHGPVVVDDLRTEKRFSGPPLLHEHGVVSGMSVIIQGRARPFGVLGAHTTRHRVFTRDDVNFLQAIANVIAAAVERSQAETALTSASAYNRRLIEASLDPLVTISPEGTITDVNAATEQATGLSREILVGTDFSDYFTEPELAREGYRRAFVSGFVRDYPLEIRHVDGHTTPVLYNASVYRDEKGNVVGLFAAARDITERKRAQEEVSRLSERNKLILDSLGEGIYGLDLEGRCTFINPAALKMLGYDSPDELVGKSIHGLIHHTRPDGSPYPEADCPLHKASRLGGMYRSIDDCYWRRDGTSFPVESVSTPIREKGALAGAVVGFFDITERKRAEEAVRRAGLYNRSLIEASMDPLVTIGSDGRITDVNAATESVTGLPRAELIGSDFADYFTDTENARSGYLRVFREGEVRDYSLEIRHRDGHITPVLYNASVYRDEQGQVAGVFAAARDISERRHAEEEVRKLTADLENRVKRRTTELEAANAELEGFSYSVSHDLRMPLRAIDGFSNILLTDYEGKLDPEGQRLLHIVRENTQKMSQLINDILAFSRTGRAEMKAERVDMQSLVSESWVQVKAEAPGRDIEFCAGELPAARGDRALLRQVMLNLLSNAVKFTRPRREAVIEVGATASADENIYFVKDNGVGFDARYAEKLFGVFQRLHRVDEFEGTGIGLAIVKRIITRHGGRVWAEGRVGEGATFYFSLPRTEVSNG